LNESGLATDESGPATDESGPALDGSGIAVAMKDNDPATIGHYLVDAEVLRDSFRDAFIAGLHANVAHGTYPTCGAALIPHSDSRKPSWHSVMNSPYRPHWYQRF
jgi:hypothetical protein